MLVIANLWNIALAVIGNIYQEKNFATFLLAILMSNLILYTTFYIIMKVHIYIYIIHIYIYIHIWIIISIFIILILWINIFLTFQICHKERILLQPCIYIVLSIVFWAAALYFFINKTISWELTSAQSRHYNKPCELLHFFDSHDIWHFLSALAMFFSFMVLLTLDDDLIDVHRSQIPVF